jgi:hypothetical protein
LLAPFRSESSSPGRAISYPWRAIFRGCIIQGWKTAKGSKNRIENRLHYHHRPHPPHGWALDPTCLGSARTRKTEALPWSLTAPECMLLVVRFYPWRSLTSTHKKRGWPVVSLSIGHEWPREVEFAAPACCLPQQALFSHRKVPLLKFG